MLPIGGRPSVCGGRAPYWQPHSGGGRQHQLNTLGAAVVPVGQGGTHCCHRGPTGASWRPADPPAELTYCNEQD